LETANQVEEETTVCLITAVEKADTDSQDGNTNLSPAASTPSIVSDSDTFLLGADSNDCSAPPSARSESLKNDNDSPRLSDHINEAAEVEQSDGQAVEAADAQETLAENIPAVTSAPPSAKIVCSDGGEACITPAIADVVEAEMDPEVCRNEVSDAPSLPDSQDEAEIAAAPVMWCTAPQGPVDGWVAVAIPTECAPPGAFDGLWKNSSDEKILIERLEIMFESGVTWDMEMLSLTNVSVTIEGETVYGELDPSGERLLWSDGDVWTFFGQSSDSPQNAAQTMGDVPCMMMPIMPENITVCEFCEEAPMPSASQWMPQQMEKWEICWDWQQKGWCPRGANCEWYHPSPDAPFF
jgi:hypothetical protein